jgi:exonuclease III
VGEYNGKYQLFSVAETMVKDTRFTDWYDQNNNCVSAPTEFSMIDHVLVTSYLLDRVNNSYIYHGYEEFCGKYNSDHYPIVVDFIL